MREEKVSVVLLKTSVELRWRRHLAFISAHHPLRFLPTPVTYLSGKESFGPVLAQGR